MRRYTGLWFVLPAIIVLGMLIVYPIAYTGMLSVDRQRRDTSSVSRTSRRSCARG